MRKHIARLALLGLGLCAATPASAVHFFNTAPVDSISGQVIGTPSVVATDPEGDIIHVAYRNATTGALLYAYRLGGNWNYETIDTGNMGQYLSIAVDYSGTPHVAYYDATNQTLKYAVRSAGWVITTITPAPGTVDEGRYCSIAVGGGYPSISCQEAVSGTYRYYSYDGLGWAREDLSPGIGSSSALKLDSAGGAHLAIMVNANEIWYFRRIATGFWNSEQVDFSGAAESLPSLALDSHGRPRVCWGNTAGGEIIYAERFPTPLGWRQEVAISQSVVGILQSAIDIGADDVPRIAALSNAGLPSDLTFARRQWDGTWATAYADTGIHKTSVELGFALDYKGDPFMSYCTGGLRVAEAADVRVRAAAPGAVRAGALTLEIYGHNLNYGGTASVTLSNAGTGFTQTQSLTPFPAFPETGQANFDLTDVGPVSLELTLSNAAGTEVYPGAVVIYEDVVDLARVTNTPSADRAPAFPHTSAGFDSLTFVSDRDGGSDVYIKGLPPNPLHFNDARPVTQNFIAAHPTWSSTGDSLVVSDTADLGLYFLNLRAMGTGRTEITLTHDFEPEWSPVDDRIAFARDTVVRTIFTIRADGADLTQLTIPGANDADSDPTWSPDGASIAFSREDGFAGTTAIYSISAATGEFGGMAPLLPPEAFTNSEPVWSPDGNWIAFTSTRSGNYDIWVMDARGSSYGLFQITDDPAVDSQPTWSPDGISIAFVSERGAGEDIFLASPLPMAGDSDGDGLNDVVDACPLNAPQPGQIDRDYDGCPDLTSSFRQVKYWTDEQLPVAYRTDVVGDPHVGDDSEWAELQAGFDAWAARPGIVLAGGDDGLHSGPSNAVSGDGLNSITFSDADGFWPGILAMTPTTSVLGDTMIGGILYRTGQIVDSDILFNTSQFSFSTPTSPGPAGAYNLRSVATHEFGHFFGLSHSSLQLSTMFYVVPRGTEAQTLEEDDLSLLRRGYASATPSLTVDGHIYRGDGFTPIPGAAVYALSAATGDTLQMTLSGVDGVYRFYEVSEDFRIWVQPLDGTAAVNGLNLRATNTLVESLGEIDFLPEYADSSSETNQDFVSSGFVFQVALAPLGGGDIITNPDLTGPSVVSTAPGDGTIDVPAVSVLSILFDEAIKLTSVPGNLTLENQSNSTFAGGGAATLQSGRLLVFTPSNPLAYGAAYQLRIGPGITDLFDNPMSDDQTVDFTVEAAPPLALASASPLEVPIGGLLVLTGIGFDAVEANNTVTFTGGVAVNPVSAGLTQLYVNVPVGAQTGDVTVSVGGSTSNPVAITIVPSAPTPQGNFLAQVGLGADPKKVAITPNGAWAYIATDQGVTAVDAFPSSGAFLSTTSVAVAGGCAGVATLADGLHAVAVGATPPKLYLIDTDPANGSFNSVIGEADLASAPLGVATLPGGDALVVYADRVTQHSLGAASLGQELREWSSPTLVFLGDISIAAGAGEAYASAATGKIGILGLGLGEGVVDELLGGVAPRETAGLPTGDGFIGVDETAVVRRFGARGPLQATLPTEGGYRGVTVSPEGNYAYAANFTANRIDILGLAGTSVAWSDSFSTGIDPRDVVTGSAGRYIYVITGESDRLEVYDTLSGPRIASVFPPSGNFGSLITVAGSGFDPVAANNVVEMGGVPALEIRGMNTDATAITVRFDDNIVTGPVVVKRAGLVSNSSPFRITKRFNPGNFTLGALVSNARTGGVLVESPTGKFLFEGYSDGTLVARRADGSASDFMFEVQVLTPAQSGLDAVADLAITPDGKKLYVPDVGDQRVAVFAVDEDATAPLTRIADLRDAGGAFVASSVTRLEITPDGHRLFFPVAPAALIEADTRSDSVLAVVPVTSAVTSLALNPLGRVAYIGQNPSVSQVAVVDVDPLSPTYRTITQAIALVGPIGPAQLLCDRTGDVLYALTGTPLVPGVDYRVEVIDADSTSATFHTGLGSHPVALNIQPTLALNYTDGVLYVLDPGASRARAFNPGSMTLQADSPSIAALAGATAMAVSEDDARLYVLTDTGSMAVFDVTAATGVQVVSGDNQTGEINLPLSAPFRLRLTGATAADVAGGFAYFMTSGGGGGFGNPNGLAYAAADANGSFEATYLAGPFPGIFATTVYTTPGPMLLTTNVVADLAAVAPEIVSTLPGPVTPPGVNTSIAVDFSKAIDPTTVTGASFILRPQGGGSAVVGAYSFADGNKRAVFKPSSALSYSTAYEYEVTVAVADADANPLANPATFAFATDAAPPLKLNAIQAPAARVGYPVVLSGTSFNATADQNRVLFGAVETTPLSGDPGALLVLVPLGANSGSVRVAVGPDTSNAVAFGVLPTPALPLNENMGDVSVPASGQQIAIVPDGSRAYMTAPGANAVVPILIAAQQSEASIAVGSHPFGVAVSPSGDRVYVTNFFTNDVSVIDANPAHVNTFKKVIKTIPTGVNPSGLAVNPDGRTLYVANYGAGTLSILDTDSLSATAYSARAEITTSSGSQSVVVTPDGGRIVVGTATGIIVIDADDTSARQTIDTSSGTQSVSVTPDGGMAVVLTTNGDLILIDILPGSPFEGQARATITTSSNSQSVAVSPDGAFVYVTTSDGTVLVFEIVLVNGSGAMAEALTSPYSLVLVQTIEVGENPTGLAFDPSGSGLLLVINSGSKTVSFINTSSTPTLIRAQVDITPNTLNLKSNGKYVTAYLQFPAYLDPSQVVLSSVRIEGTLPAEDHEVELADQNGDGILEFVANFSRKGLYEVMPAGQRVPLTVTGIISGLQFTASDTIRVICPGMVKPHAGEIVAGGAPTEIRWIPIQDGPAHHVDIFWTRDLGASWDTVVVGTPDDSSFVWTPPAISSQECLVMVVARSNEDDVLGIGLEDEPFTIALGLDVRETLPTRFAVLPAAPNPFLSATRIAFELPAAADVTVRIFAPDGSLVRALVDRREFPAGRHAVPWDGADGGGRTVSAGVYFVKIQADSEIAVRKVVRVP